MSPGRTGDFLTGTRQAYDACPDCTHARHLHPPDDNDPAPRVRAHCSGVVPKPDGTGFAPCDCTLTQDFKIGE